MDMENLEKLEEKANFSAKIGRNSLSGYFRPVQKLHLELSNKLCILVIQNLLFLLIDENRNEIESYSHRDDTIEQQISIRIQ